MKHNRGFASGLIIILVVVVIGLGYFAYNASKNDSNSNKNSYQPQGLSSRVIIPTKNNPILTQAEAEALVYKTWSDCSKKDCGGVTVTLTQNNAGQYIVTAIFDEYDDSISNTKKVSIATMNNGVWVLSQPTITRTCSRGNADGTKGWTSGLCI